MNGQIHALTSLLMKNKTLVLPEKGGQAPELVSMLQRTNLFSLLRGPDHELGQHIT